MEKKKCVFLINTEFVLLISLLYTKYELDSAIEPVFVLIKNSKRRFTGINLEKLPGKVYVFNNEIHSNKIRPDKRYLDLHQLENVVQIHFQNPQDLINSSLVAYFKTKNPETKITLVSDSIAIDRKILTKPRDLFIHYSRLIFRKFINRIPNISLKIWSYHKMPFVPNELIAHKNYGYANFIDTKILFGKIEESFELLSSVYQINNEQFKKSEILFFTQPNLNYSTYSDEIKKGYINGVKDFSQLAKKYKIPTIIKVHPAENPDVYTPFCNEFVSVDVNSNTPAEILINGLFNKKIVSYWSSISMYDIFNKHQHFWLYKTIGYKLPSSDVYQNLSIPENLDEIEKMIFQNSL